MTEPAVEVSGLGLTRGSVLAVDDVTFSVSPGEIFGVIGPDGAGKTTLFRILATLLVPDRGTARVMGHDVVTGMWPIRSLLGYMPGRFSLYPDLTVLENLSFYAAVFGTTVADAHEVIAPIWDQLARFSERRAGALSGGMKQKLALCCALVHRPRLLILDEPTTGVDAVSRGEFWDLLSRLRDSGLPILVSTPYMDEALRCDRVALMQEGRLLAIDSPLAFGDRYPLPLLAVRSRDRLGLLAGLRALPTAASAWPFGESIHYTDARSGTPPEVIVAELLAWAASKGLEAFSAEPIAAGVEDAFIQLMTRVERAA